MSEVLIHNAGKAGYLPYRFSLIYMSLIRQLHLDMIQVLDIILWKCDISMCKKVISFNTCQNRTSAVIEDNSLLVSI